MIKILKDIADESVDILGKIERLKMLKKIFCSVKIENVNPFTKKFILNHFSNRSLVCHHFVTKNLFT